MTKRERVEAALAGRPVDRIPVSAWSHLLPAEKTTAALADAAVKWFRDYDWDWIKVNPRATVFAEGFGARFDLGACRGWGFGVFRSRFRGRNRRRLSLESRFEAIEPSICRRKMPGRPESPKDAPFVPASRASGRPPRSGVSPASALRRRLPCHPGPLGRKGAPNPDTLPNTYYGVLPRLIAPTRPFTLDDLKPADPSAGSWGEHVDLLASLKKRLDGTPFVQTLFSPASVLGFLVGRPTATTQQGVADNHASTLLHLIRTQPRTAHQALEIITSGLEKLARASVDAGADGLFFAITKLAREGALSTAEFEEFGKPYDLRVLQAVADARFHVLHLCGARVHWNQAVDYPVHALNWASVGQGNKGLAEARQTTGLALIGGVDEVRLIQTGTPADVEAAARRALEEGGPTKFLLSPGCCVEPDAPAANLKALRRAVDD